MSRDDQWISDEQLRKILRLEDDRDFTSVDELAEDLRDARAESAKYKKALQILAALTPRTGATFIAEEALKDG